MSDRVYRVLRLNPRLKRKFLEVLCQTPISKPVIIDEQLYPDSIIFAIEDTDTLMRLDPVYYGYARQGFFQITLEQYLSYRLRKTLRKIQVGSRVVLILDGHTYLVRSIDGAHGTAVIYMQGKSIVMRVPLSVLRLR